MFVSIRWIDALQKIKLDSVFEMKGEEDEMEYSLGDASPGREMSGEGEGERSDVK